jgi:YbbR domain-containing protein
MIPKTNIKPLIGSIILAIILWLIVAMQKEYVHQVDVPINLVRIAEGKTLAKPIPKAASFEFIGKGRSLIAMMFYNVQLNLELPELNHSQTIELNQYLHFLDLPVTFGLEISELIEPRTIDFVIDDLEVVKKPVLLSGSVGTENGYVLLGYTLNPDTVQITGPRSVLIKQDYVFTEVVEIAGQKRNFSERIALKNPVEEITKIEPDRVEATFNIQRLIERVVYDIPINVIHVPSQLIVEAVPGKMSLKIKGGENLVADVAAEDIIAEIDFAKNYQVEKESYGASIVTPENISWIESIPKSFKLKVRRRSRHND